VVGESGVTWWWPLLPVVGMWVFGVARVPQPVRLTGRDQR